MPISTQCPGCQGRFNLPDHLVGQNVKCQGCQTVFTAIELDPLEEFGLNPDEFIDHSKSTSGLQSDNSQKTTTEKKHSTTYVKTASGKSDKGEPLLVGVVVGAIVLLLAALGIGLWFLLAPSGDEVADRSGGENNGEVVSEEGEGQGEGEDENATKENSNPESSGPNQAAINDLNQQFANMTVTVKFTNINGDTSRARRYLRAKILDAAYFDYRQAAAKANEQTLANKQRAEQEARKNAAPSTFPRLVYYEYQQVQSPLPFPSILGGNRNGSTMSFNCGPCKSPAVFSNNIGMPNSSVQGNVITVRCDFKGQIPHPDVEKLINEHGRQSVVKVIVGSAKGPSDLVTLYIREKTPRKSNEFSPRITVAGIEPINDDAYVFHAGAVNDVEEYATTLGSECDWAEVSKIDSANRTIYLTANLPSPLPTAAEFRELKNLRWQLENEERRLRQEQERLAREEKREKERASDEADRNGQARPGEANADWIARNFAEKSTLYFDDFLVNLTKTEVEPEILDSVSSNLVTTLEQSPTTQHTEELIDAMLVWRTDETDAAILAMVENSKYSSQVKELMAAMETIGTAESAEKLAMGLAHRSEGDLAKKHLIAMGKITEPSVSRYMKHEDLEVRNRAYEVLYYVGTRESLSVLKENRQMEKRIDIKKNIKSVLDAIEERYPEEEE